MGTSYEKQVNDKDHKEPKIYSTMRLNIPSQAITPLADIIPIAPVPIPTPVKTPVKTPIKSVKEEVVQKVETPKP